MSISSPPSILVIEENKHVRLFVCVNLQKQGYTPYAAATLDDALKLGITAPLDAALIEIPYSRYDPSPYLIALLAVPFLHRVPIVAFAAQPFELHSLQAMNHDIVSVLVKPIAADHLLAAVTAAVPIRGGTRFTDLPF